MAVYFQKREVVVPGQLLAEGRYRPSYGTYDENGKIYSTLVGLAELRGNTVKVVALEGAYIPKEGDLVIGIITTVAGNNWKVDIGGPYGASLHANNALRRPYSDDISEYMDIGDVISAEVIAFDRQTGPFLSMKGRGLRVLDKGMLFDVSPAKIPRIIGRRGSMINMITDHLRIQTVVGQNGRIWIKAPDTASLRLAIKAFKTIEAQAHTSNLTERINTMLAAEVAEIRSTAPTIKTGKDTENEAVEEEESVDTEQSDLTGDETNEAVDDIEEQELEMDENPDEETENAASDDIEDELEDKFDNEEVNEK
ncbi:MAG: exosome complex RNA-binding protein Rrp4 [Candidatus Thorarchaeota archaeon]|nr:exosome complex RNA-binding protein Rrp4 [Candidatus Thorarchaeota archaeon]